jgi:phosphoribosylformimino-5-aminoimidazole carboxamide ribotide isomerase
VILYPAVDIRGGQAVRLLHGDYGRETVYDADPVEAARRWSAAGAEHLHVVDLDGARQGRPANLEVVRRIAASVPARIQAGGGLRDLDAVAAVIEAGAERVVLGTAALEDPALLASALDEYGERVVAAVDARGGRATVAGWTRTSDLDPAQAVADLGARGVARFLFTPIDVDGTMAGPRIAELRGVASAAGDREVVYSGGVGSLDDLRDLAAAAVPNLTGVVVGRALYEGRFAIGEAKLALNPR